MPRKNSNRPTDAELAILAVLWEHGPSTVREVFERLDGQGGYTTVLKFLQIMTEKGLVERDEAQRAHIYVAAKPREETQGNLVRDLTVRAFAGSASDAISQPRATRWRWPTDW